MWYGRDHVIVKSFWLVQLLLGITTSSEVLD
jgi:hypothetical protein